MNYAANEMADAAADHAAEINRMQESDKIEIKNGEKQGKEIRDRIVTIYSHVVSNFGREHTQSKEKRKKRQTWVVASNTLLDNF